MRVDLFDFDLPETSIALRPVSPRDCARLLYVDPQAEEGKEFQDKSFLDLPGYLNEKDILVFNDTRVIPSRLFGMRYRDNGSGARIELMLHMREDNRTWRAFARPAKRLKVGDIIVFSASDDNKEALSCKILEKGEDGEVVVLFSLSGAMLDLALIKTGELPLPPYIAGKRKVDWQDRDDYQTVFARHDGAVAAPTAGLHFTERLLSNLKEKGIQHHYITLHVGAGTFLPVKVNETDDHKMHAERGIITQETADILNKAREEGGRIIAVGTTSLRLLESAADEKGRIRPFSSSTDIFITPGYTFRAVDGLITNFHLPRSTLFMLVSAFSGFEIMRRAYRHAIDAGYRFYSYGDGSFLLKAE